MNSGEPTPVLTPLQEIERNARDVITQARDIGSHAIIRFTEQAQNDTPLLVATEIASESLATTIPEAVTVKLTELSDRFGVSVRVVDAAMNQGGSFKLRGAQFKVNRLPAGSDGLIAASAGNHSQGVAIAANNAALPATIFMPSTAPVKKYEATKNLGGDMVTVIHDAENFDAARQQAEQMARAHPEMVFIHPYDDPDVMLGQGTLGLSILRQNPDMTHLFIPIGGGGLAGGVAAYIKARRPEVLIVGVEPVGSACGYAALHAGKPVPIQTPDPFADGLAVKQLGRLPHALIEQHLDGIILVTNDQIGDAMHDLNRQGMVSEPAGATGVAGLKQYIRGHALQHSGASLVTIRSGSNIDTDRFDQIIAEAEVRAQRYEKTP